MNTPRPAVTLKDGQTTSEAVQSSETVPRFTGTAAEIGAARRQIWGEAWSAFLAGRLARGEVMDAGRVAVFRAILEDVAPEWLEEAEAFAGAETEAYLDFQCREPHPDPGGPEGTNCSTLLALGSAVREGRTLLLKIRDEAPNSQIMWRHHLTGRQAVLAGSNLGNLGIAQAANAAGLTGANNTGGPLTDQRSDVALNDCLVMRLIAERCATCADAVTLLEDLSARGVLGNGGYARGMIFVLADATGQGVLVECSRRQVQVERVRDGFHVYTNHYRLPALDDEIDHARDNEPAVRSSFARCTRMEALAARQRPLTREALVAISRDQEGEFPLCQTDSPFPWRTVSSWIHEYGPKGLPVTTHVCNVAPVLADYFQVPPLSPAASP